MRALPRRARVDLRAVPLEHDPAGRLRRARSRRRAGSTCPDEVDDALATLPRATRLRTARRRAAATWSGARRRPRVRRPVVLRGAGGRGDDVFADRQRPAAGRPRAATGRSTRQCSARPAAAASRSEGAGPGGTLLVFADAGRAPTARPSTAGELTVLGCRSATPRHMEEAAALLPSSTCPSRACCRSSASTRASSCTAAAKPSRSFSRREGADLPRAGRRPARGRAAAGAGPGDVLVQVEVALTDGTDAKAFRRGHPLLLGPPPSPFGHEFCGVDAATGRRVVAANSAPCGECAPCRRGEETLCEHLLPLLNGAYAELICSCRSGSHAQPPPRPERPRARGRRARRAARVLPARRRARGGGADDTVAILGAGPIGLMLCACVADAGGTAVRRRRASGAARARADFGGRPGPRRRRRDRSSRDRAGVARRARARPARAAPSSSSVACLATRRCRRLVPPALRGADAARRVPPHAGDRARRARVPRERPPTHGSG